MTPEAGAARERKQKIFVAVGGLLLLGILAIQVPKLLGGSSSSSAPVPQATAPGQSPAGSPISSSAAVAPGGGAALQALEPQKLRSFSFFARKDPFVQQVVTPSAATAEAKPSSGGDAPAKSGGEKVPSEGFTVGDKPTASVTVIAVNGSRQALAPGGTFPAQDPVFVLIAEQPKAKTVTIGVAGGVYANGKKTTTLKVGKPVVLENTTTGARYRIVLVAVGNGSSTPAASPKTPQDASTP